MGNWMGYSAEAPAMNCWQYGENRAGYCWERACKGRRSFCNLWELRGRARPACRSAGPQRRGGRCSGMAQLVSCWAIRQLPPALPDLPASTAGLSGHRSTCEMLCLILCGLPASAGHRKLRIPNTQSKAHKRWLTRQGAELPWEPLQDQRGYRLSNWS